MKKIAFLISICFSCMGAFAYEYNDSNYLIQNAVKDITEVMVHDAINPPAAARFYAYTCLAGCKVLETIDNNQFAVTKIIKGFPEQFFNCEKEYINPYFTVTYAMLKTAGSIIPSGYMLENKLNLLEKNFTRLPKKNT